MRRRRAGCARPRSSTTTAPSGTATRRSTSGTRGGRRTLPTSVLASTARRRHARVLWPHLRAGYRASSTGRWRDGAWRCAVLSGRRRTTSGRRTASASTAAGRSPTQPCTRRGARLSNGSRGGSATPTPPPPTRRTNAVARGGARAAGPRAQVLRHAHARPAGGPRRRHQTGTDEGGCLMCTKRRQTRALREWKDGELVDVRELAGLSSPWYFGAADDARYAEAFAQLTADGGFGAKWGLRTAERRHPCYNFSTNCVTSWHAPVWPFETSKMLTGLARKRWPGFARGGGGAPRRDARRVRRSFAYVRADAHAWRRRGRGGGRAVRGRVVPPRRRRPADAAADVPAEDMRRSGAATTTSTPPSSTTSSPASSGSERARRRRRSHTRRASSCSLASPPSSLRTSPRRAVAVRGGDVAVAWDRDGSRYGGRKGLSVWVDGRAAAHSPEPRRLEVPLRA